MEQRERMKILRLNAITSFRGGAETYIENINDMLESSGHETLTVTFNSGESLEPTENYIEVKTNSNPFSRFINDPLPKERIFNFLTDIYNKFNPDIIHLHHLRIEYASIEKFLMETTTPILFTAHDALLVCPLSTLVQPGGKICDGGIGLRCAFTGCKVHGHLSYELLLSASIKKLNEKRIVGFLCPSYSIYNYLHNNGFAPVVHLPSFSKFETLIKKNEPNFNSILKRKNIGYMGRLESYKGVHDLIEAFSIFTTKHPEYRLKIAGIGSYEKRLKEKAKKIGISNKIDWLGKITGKEREQFFNDVSMIVVPSNYWENFALIAQEALLRGIPAIGTRIGGIPEIIQDGLTGRIVPISSPHLLNEALEDTITDKKKTLELAKKGRSFIINNVSPELHFKGLLNIYSRVIKGEYIPDRTEAIELKVD